MIHKSFIYYSGSFPHYKYTLFIFNLNKKHYICLMTLVSGCEITEIEDRGQWICTNYIYTPNTTNAKELHFEFIFYHETLN